VSAERKAALVILALTLVFAVYVRFFNLGIPSFWADELDFVDAARSQARVGQPLLASGYAYPRAPLLTYSLMASYAVFGVSESSSRLPSAVFGFLSIVAVFVVGQRWFNVRVGLIAAIFMACAPFEVGWSRICRMYALFQLLFLLAMFFFYQGFERSSREGFRRVTSWELHLPSLLIGLILLFLSYTTHQNAALFGASFAVYLMVMALLTATRCSWGKWLRSKYTLLCFLSLGALLAALVIPGIRDFLAYAVGYQPKWAEVASAQNRWRIFEFFMNRSHFPINILCLVGVFQVLHRRNQPGLYALLNLVVPVLLFSFIFQYRKNDYIYHVYPVLFLLAALPVERVMTLLVERFAAQLLKFRLAKESFLFAAVLFWVPLTPGFRYAQKIPRLTDGQFNGAVFHNEWRAATDYVSQRQDPHDVLISTLPLSVQYYLGRIDYNLNWSNAALAKEQKITNQNGRLVDFYSGADILDDLDELKVVLANHQHGWLLVDNYRFNNAVYVPADVNAFVKQQMQKVYETENRTMSVYRWRGPDPLSATN